MRQQFPDVRRAVQTIVSRWCILRGVGRNDIEVLIFLHQIRKELDPRLGFIDFGRVFARGMQFDVSTVDSLGSGSGEFPRFEAARSDRLDRRHGFDGVGKTREPTLRWWRQADVVQAIVQLTEF